MNVSKSDNQQSSCNDNIVCLTDINVVYGNYVALYNINLDIDKGEFVGICGPNGSGKTTLLKTIIGLVKPLTGDIKLYGNDISEKISKEIRFKFGYVPQFAPYDKNFPATVKDVVEMGTYAKAGLFKRITDKDRNKAIEILKLVDMEHFVERPIGHLSGGQQQKIMIAQALAAEAEVLLLDEPTSALDFRMTEDVMELLDFLNHTHKITIVTINHNIKLLRAFTKRIICLNKMISYDGPTSDSNLDDVINKIFY
ncbi:MAG: ABC transporter ATP-binding protein [Candidatus Heimdallarchaeota archaeon]|nr:ABC transporter ATP-binding protein [Candidatus Heimdallarchaeota archaeon]